MFKTRTFGLKSDGTATSTPLRVTWALVTEPPAATPLTIRKVFRPGAEIVLAAPSRARLMLLGGAPMDGPRHIWWNFVSSSSERIEAAKADWKAGRFARVIGETEFIPLPE